MDVKNTKQLHREFAAYAPMLGSSLNTRGLMKDGWVEHDYEQVCYPQLTTQHFLAAWKVSYETGKPIMEVLNHMQECLMQVANRTNAVREELAKLHPDGIYELGAVEEWLP